MAERGPGGRFLPKGGGGAGAPSGGGTAPETDKSTSAFAKAAAAAKAFGGAAMSKVLGGVKSVTPALKGLGGFAKTLASGDLPSATKAMGMLGSALGSGITSGAEKLGTVLKGMGPQAAAVGEAIQIVGAAVGGLVSSFGTLMGMAIDVTQKMDLMRDRFAALAGSAAGGKEVQAMLGKLSASLPFASAQVSEWGQGLLAAGVKGKQLEADIKAVAAATALMGESGGAAAMTLFKRLGEGGPAADKLLKTFQSGGPKADKLLKEMGLSIADLGGKAALAKMTSEQLHEALAKAMAKKGAGPLADLALTLPAILQKAREGFMSLFAKLGPSVKPFMKAVKDLFGNFNKGTPTIKALQKIVTQVFSVIFKYATMAVKAISGLFKGGGAAKTITSIWKGLGTAVGFVAKILAPVGSLLKAVYKNAFLMNGIKTIFKVIGVVLLVIVGIIGAVIVAFVAIAGVVGAVVGAVVGFVGGIVDAVGGLASSAWEAASGFIDGLLGGIQGGAGAIIAAVAGLAKGALGAFKGALGIASPSKVMMQMGGHVAAGTADGIDAGAGKVADAGAGLGSAVTSGAAKGMAGAGGGKGKGGGGVTINGGLHLHASGGDAQTMAEELFAAFMERLAASQGLGAGA